MSDPENPTIIPAWESQAKLRDFVLANDPHRRSPDHAGWQLGVALVVGFLALYWAVRLLSWLLQPPPCVEGILDSRGRCAPGAQVAWNAEANVMTCRCPP